ncbi:hypothetical protein NTE_01264 [Candidatus Nitrososphaera evergladensis SR1]|uniref:Uncharacterized protein n=1 Tax=Candidatus Nitrososphaera evergladensis SR1 TaxID=1459636 RepID=A0A075MQ72_9ARCH|nr:hypothetical protein [Candidatus Nitrososphaera evergladensis]AIF83333.1 hypothetical protein NTE_01264 [Candidatus Nitrososphaera evergladensis SR1]
MSGQNIPENDKEEEIAELRSLGVDPKRKTGLDDKKELKELADIIKQSMLQDYKTAYSKKGSKFEQEAGSAAE